MNDIARNPEYDSLFLLIQQIETELAELVHDRDKLLYHLCPKLQTKYMLSVGKLEYAVFECQCKILRTKRKIDIIQAFLNREQSYNIAGKLIYGTIKAINNDDSYINIEIEIFMDD